MLLEVIADVCTACAPSSPPIVPTVAGDIGTPTTSPPPDSADRSNRPGDDSPSDVPPADAPPADDDRSWWDRLFDSGKSDVDDGSHDVAGDVTKSVGKDMATEVALDVAGKRLPWSSGVLGALGTIVGGSETLAEGITVINENDGRGMGGSSKSGREAWDAIDRELGIERRDD